ncbi:Predicted membrane protein [Mycobacteroides abscessus]|nr:Predicted membrane protein [Mycobacteroides abscessus]
MTSGALLASAVELHSFASISHVILDYLGTLAFAMSAALLAVEKKFDIVGLAVLAMVTAIGGGVLRDVIIGQHPPAAFTGFSHIGIALAAAGLVFLWQPPAKLTGGRCKSPMHLGWRSSVSPAPPSPPTAGWPSRRPRYSGP